MNKDEYRRRLEELAIIKDIKPVKTAMHNRRAIESVTEYDEDGEPYEVFKEVTENPTLGFELVKIKDRIDSCELGCGVIATNQVIEKRFCSHPVPHWRTRCANCQKYVSPDGKQFINGGAQIVREFVKFFKQQGIDIPNEKTNPIIGEQVQPVLDMQMHNSVVEYNDGVERRPKWIIGSDNTITLRK
jgi:hypothetical protein